MMNRGFGRFILFLLFIILTASVPVLAQLPDNAGKFESEELLTREEMVGITEAEGNSVENGPLPTLKGLTDICTTGGKPPKD